MNTIVANGAALVHGFFQSLPTESRACLIVNGKGALAAVRYAPVDADTRGAVGDTLISDIHSAAFEHEPHGHVRACRATTTQ